MVRGILIVAIAGCTAAAPRAAQPELATVRIEPARPPTLVFPNETFEFVGKLHGIQVARVQSAVGDAGYVDGKRAIIIRSRGFAEGVLSLVTELTWELTTTLDLEGGLPLEHLEEAWLIFRGEQDHERDERSLRAGDTDHDVHSLICALRGWTALPHEPVKLTVAIGGAQIRLEVWEAGRGEWIGKFPAVRFEGVGRGKYPFTVWISDDADRVPLLVKAETKWGDIIVELVEYGSNGKTIALR